MGFGANPPAKFTAISPKVSYDPSLCCWKKVSLKAQLNERVLPIVDDRQLEASRANSWVQKLPGDILCSAAALGERLNCGGPLQQSGEHLP